MINLNKIKEKVYKNSIETCEYLEGYQDRSSTIKVKCLIHDYIFETKYENVARDNRAHHICPFCKEEDKNKRFQDSREEVECAYCKKRFFKNKSSLNNSRSGLYFCCREHKDLAQRVEFGLEEIWPEHYLGEGSTINTYRKVAFRNYKLECAICKWNEDSDILEVHHIDENRQNNELENLIILCPICHRKLTSHKYKMINREQLVLC